MHIRFLQQSHIIQTRFNYRANENIRRMAAAVTAGYNNITLAQASFTEHMLHNELIIGSGFAADHAHSARIMAQNPCAHLKAWRI